MSYNPPNYQSIDAAAIPVRVVGGSGGGSPPYIYTTKGFQQITDISSATNLTVPSGAKYAFINVEGSANVRWRDDSTSPTTTVGMVLAPGVELSYAGNLAAIQFIQTAASSILNVTYYS